MTVTFASLATLFASFSSQGIFDPLQGLVHRAAAAFTSSLALLIVVISAAVPWIAVIILSAWLFLQGLRFWVRRRREAKARQKA